MSKTSFRIALAGNPNCGKTCIFNALTGARQHVGNYPGVTVESKGGSFKLNGMNIELIDLPGVYSLSSSSPEEEVVFQELTKPGIDLIINVIDSTIPQRSLYLTTQLAELHIPMLLTFNMADDAKKKGLKYNIPKLEKYFGSPIVQTVGNSSNGVQPLLQELARTLSKLEDHGVPMLTYGSDVDDAIKAVADKIDDLKIEKYQHIPSRFFAIKLLEHDTCVWRLDEFQSVHNEVEDQIKHLLDQHAIEADTFMADRRYAMLSGACRDTITITQERRREISDKIDAVLTNKFLGFPIFLAIMYATFWFTFTVAEPPMEWIENFFGWLGEFVGGILPEGFFNSLIVDGIIGGVGGVIVFLPNILLLFFAIAILEDSGYMSRASFVMDGIMRKFGLQGRSFVPLVLGFGCTVPAVMATRTIESERDRTVTIMVLPLMSCGARLPIYALLIPAFFPEKYQAFTMWIVYIIGIVIALIAARIMKSTLFKGEGEVYLMELPPYRMPTVKSMMLHMWDRSKMYLQKAGTIILATSIILYLCNTYPEKTEFSQDYDAQIEAAQKAGAAEDDETVVALENAKQNETLEYTISGRAGKVLEPIFAPMGFDWKISTATIGALAAKEVFVAQMGILYSEGEADEESEGLRATLRKQYTPLQAFCMMLFALLSIPCLATLAIIKRELNSWKMAVMEGAGLFVLAWVITTIVYQVGSLLKIGTTIIG
ncbi:MAG: ferrous iron transport protein B [Lentisphaeria bacterium]|nr:ferrous iron transport protein B [Lentisphaeria bacterium]